VASHGIRDRVAIVGMGCTNFTENWGAGLDDLLIDAANATYQSAGVGKDDIDAYWFGTAQSGMSGITLARPLQLQNRSPASRTTAPPAPRHCARLPTPWPPAPTTP
jgi:acetyl-CoA C-acetyltransferase